MSVHSDVRKLMYEYLRGELSPAAGDRVRAHLAICGKCAQEFHALEETIAAMSEPRHRPSDARTDLYWQQFAQKVERRIESAGEANSDGSFVARLLDALVEHKKPFGIGFASALSIVALVFAAWSLWFSSSSLDARSGDGLLLHSERGSMPNIERTSLERRADDYLERSKVLLIGLMNSDPQSLRESAPFMKRQRELSRSLLHESTQLASDLNNPSQRQLRELVADLGIILMQISNLESDHAVQGVQIVRSGVEQNGILFKINLEEIQRATHRGSQPDKLDKSLKPST